MQSSLLRPRSLPAVGRAVVAPLQPSLRQLPVRAATLNPGPIAAAGLDALSQQASTSPLVVGAIAGVTLLGGLAWAMTNNGAAAAAAAVPPQAQREPEGPPQPPPLPRENAILVLGASGRVGRKVVQRLIRQGATVVAAATKAEAVEKVLTGDAVGLQAGRQTDGDGILFFGSVDIKDKDSLRNRELWEGVTQVINLVGGKAGPLPTGGFGYFPGQGPQEVETAGAANLVEVLPEVLPTQRMQFKTVLPMGSEEEVAVWERMDDVIMGGNSSSNMSAGPGVCSWRGELVLEGGGFCGQRTKTLTPQEGDLSAYDGIALRVKGDGQIFKLNIKTVDQLDKPENTYQTTFDTVDGQWSDVYLPWHNFVSVKRAQSDPDGAPLDPSKVAKFGIVLSRFEFNKMPNPSYKPGSFELQIEGGFRAYRAVRPQLVQLSSAAVERNAIVGDDREKRKKDVPIVQLNPGGLLNWKYAAEIAIRSSGYPYTVIRSTGMIDSNENGPFLFEADQGDRITGTVSRDDVADIVVAAVTNPESCGKTYEVRRNEALDARGKTMSPADFNRMFLKLALDRNRWRVGLQPFPKYVDPPPPVTDEQRKEIRSVVAATRAERRDALREVAPQPRAGDTFIAPASREEQARQAAEEAAGSGAQGQQQGQQGEAAPAGAEKELVSAGTKQ